MPRRRRRKKNSFVTLKKWSDSPTYQNLFLNYDKTLTSSEDRSSSSQKIKDLREAAIIHKKARQYIQTKIKPGMKIFDICNELESKVIELCGENTLSRGMGFPTGISINEIAAHDSANPNDKRVLKRDDICKIDFGVHVNGNIIDSAFTVCFNHKFEPIIKATQDGTWTGIKLSGPDARLYEISEGIQEAIESYEYNNKPIKAICNLGGHNIEPYKIHAGKLVLGAPHESIDKNIKMKVGECYAIETFASTGTGYVKNDRSRPCNHYMRKYNPPRVPFKLKSTKKLYNYIQKERTSLPFCTRWIPQNSSSGLNDLINKGILEEYPPLIDPNSLTSQWEHTIYLHENCKEVLSYGDDY